MSSVFIIEIFFLFRTYFYRISLSLFGIINGRQESMTKALLLALLDIKLTFWVEMVKNYGFFSIKLWSLVTKLN